MSLQKETNRTSTPLTNREYVKKDGVYIKQFPPLGETIRQIYLEASNSSNNLWVVSDKIRNTREIQGVSCETGGIFAQDHTFEVVKNYPKALGAKAVWDVATHTGEIASAVCVPSTQTRHLAHAAQQLISRKTFNPSVMYSDTWPNKSEFWESIMPGLEGRLGLFHYEKRILKTLRKKHIDYHDAVGDLLFAVYTYDEQDYEKLLVAMKKGTLSSNGKPFTDKQIDDLKGTKQFRDRHGKYLRKRLRSPETMRQAIDNWFCTYKVTASPGSRPGRGRLDPLHKVPLFNHETKDAVENCKDKAEFLTDPLPIEKMYDRIAPSPNSKHGLSEHLSRRGESKLEAFHDRFAHFANSGMRDSLADCLNLSGTARYNLAIRHKRSLMLSSVEAGAQVDRTHIPAAWERVPPYYNHSELGYVNRMARAVGLPPPFPNA